ncbi:MAG: serine/threonine protein kinase, partial [Lachnospiraceae bacterium]|nr:serine/threonine protein kinase [Lachnospiraceae bacterium]
MAQKFREWTIKKCIGEGAFGKVFLIEREEFGNVYQAALKVIEIPKDSGDVKMAVNEGMSKENVTEYFYGMVKRIVDEFTLMSKLKGNSNIVSYEDHFVQKKKDKFGWTIFIRMELLTPLYDYMRVNTITVKDVIKLGIDICHALEICQKYNIIHRDIKPENIFISDVGDFKLGDFGIARELEKTASGLSRVGTKSYIAPEVYKGLEYNSTVDIYSLGLVMYRFLNRNRMPFMPPAPEKISFSDKERADMMRFSGQALPKPCNADGRLAEIVLKACAYDPKERYESAADMKRALEEILYTEREKQMVYPEGDELENSRAEYLEELKEESSADGEADVEVDSGTRYLFAQNE